MDSKKKDDDYQQVGVKAVLDQALQSYEKLPMLEIVFERLVRSMTSSLRNLTSETVEIDVEEFHSLRFNKYFNNLPSNSVISVFKAVEWGNVGLLTLDYNCISAFVDILLGGKKKSGDKKVSTNADNKDERGVTYIEQSIARQIVDVVLNELGVAFEPISSTTFTFERMESNPTFAAIARPGDAIILLELDILFSGKKGKIDIVIPYSTIDPIKPKLQQMFLGDKFGVDASWENQMVNRVHDVSLPLDVVLNNKDLTLREVASFKVGDTILTNHKKDEDVIIRCKDVLLFKASMGRIEDKIAVNINKNINEEEID